MAVVNACVFPEELLYALEEGSWVRLEPDGTVTMGMTDPSQTKAGKMLTVSFRHSKKVLPRGKGGATLEGSKWVGPFVLPLSGKIVAVNPRVQTDAGVVNRDPYGEGWFLRLEPSNWEAEKDCLVSGPQAIDHFRDVLAKEEFSCIRCADGPA